SSATAYSPSTRIGERRRWQSSTWMGTSCSSGYQIRSVQDGSRLTLVPPNLALQRAESPYSTYRSEPLIKLMEVVGGHSMRRGATKGPVISCNCNNCLP